MIGIFDSGSGGLTVARAIRALAPNADLLYFGDTANAPYGNRSVAEIETLTLGILRMLRRRGCTTIVSACNSVSATVIRPMFELFGVDGGDIVEMVGPAVDALRSKNVRNVAVLATNATCRSRMYGETCQKKEIRAVEIVCPALAGAIESGDISAIDAAVEEVVEKIPSNISDVLLACTHYPLVTDQFERAAQTAGRNMCFIDPAESVALAAIRKHGVEGDGDITVACSKPSAIFDRFVQDTLGVDPSRIEIISA